MPGRRAHSARSWLGDNAVHAAAPLLDHAGAVRRRASVEIDGCTYREGLNAVRIEGGVAGNVVPDVCTVTVNFRFAPDRTEEQALEHVREVLAPYALRLTDSSPGALPGLAAPAARHFLDAVGGEPVAKYGWTDVARFAALGIPAVNYGPGDPGLAHTREEHVRTPLITEAAALLRRYLSGVRPAATPRRPSAPERRARGSRRCPRAAAPPAGRSPSAGPPRGTPRPAGAPRPGRGPTAR